MKQIIFIILTLGFFSCSRGKMVDSLTNDYVDNSDILEKLYHQCDTIIRNADTLKIVNSKFDTTIIETGIFTFLQYDYPLTTPSKLIKLSKTAIQLEKNQQNEKAKTIYNKVLNFYFNERPKELNGYSDMNCYLQYEVNSAILCSFAFERLGDKDNAIKTLKPFLANVEAWNSRIHERYILLCIDKFGIDKVKSELNNCGKTIKQKKQNVPEIEDWVVNVFGGDIGVGKTCLTGQISIVQADSLVKQMDFYKLTE